jgi:hypothetical protein
MDGLLSEGDHDGVLDELSPFALSRCAFELRLMLYSFAIKRIAVWKLSSPRYAPVSTTEAV